MNVNDKYIMQIYTIGEVIRRGGFGIRWGSPRPWDISRYLPEDFKAPNLESLNQFFIQKKKKSVGRNTETSVSMQNVIFWLWHNEYQCFNGNIATIIMAEVK